MEVRPGLAHHAQRRAERRHAGARGARGADRAGAARAHRRARAGDLHRAVVDDGARARRARQPHRAEGACRHGPAVLLRARGPGNRRRHPGWPRAQGQRDHRRSRHRRDGRPHPVLRRRRAGPRLQDRRREAAVCRGVLAPAAPLCADAHRRGQRCRRHRADVPRGTRSRAGAAGAASCPGAYRQPTWPLLTPSERASTSSRGGRPGRARCAATAPSRWPARPTPTAQSPCPAPRRVIAPSRTCATSCCGRHAPSRRIWSATRRCRHERGRIRSCRTGDPGVDAAVAGQCPDLRAAHADPSALPRMRRAGGSQGAARRVHGREIPLGAHRTGVVPAGPGPRCPADPPRRGGGRCRTLRAGARPCGHRPCDRVIVGGLVTGLARLDRGGRRRLPRGAGVIAGRRLPAGDPRVPRPGRAAGPGW